MIVHSRVALLAQWVPPLQSQQMNIHTVKGVFNNICCPSTKKTHLLQPLRLVGLEQGRLALVLLQSLLHTELEPRLVEEAAGVNLL